jgi:AraC-like DNA-binding protein
MRNLFFDTKSIEKYFHYKKNTENAGTKILKSYGSGIVYNDSEYSNSQIMTSVLFEYIISGEGFIKYNGETYRVEAGDCVIIRPNPENKPISYGADKENPYTKYWFTFMGTFADNVFKAYDIDDLIIINKCDVINYFEELLSTISNESVTLSDFSVTIVKILNKLFLSQIVTEKDVTLKSKIQLYVSQRLTNPHSILEISSYFGISERNFSNYFKKHFGCTYHKYVAKERLKFARTLLLNTNRYVSEIARELNFCDQSYFSHSFKKEFGVYPSQIREMHK